jgi:hypothetical protein
LVTIGKPERIVHLYGNYHALPDIHAKWDGDTDRHTYRHTIPDSDTLHNSSADCHNNADGYSHCDGLSVAGVHTFLYCDADGYTDSYRDVHTVHEFHPNADADPDTTTNTDCQYDQHTVVHARRHDLPHTDIDWYYDSDTPSDAITDCNPFRDINADTL